MFSMYCMCMYVRVCVGVQVCEHIIMYDIVCISTHCTLYVCTCVFGLYLCVSVCTVCVRMTYIYQKGNVSKIQSALKQLK